MYQIKTVYLSTDFKCCYALKNLLLCLGLPDPDVSLTEAHFHIGFLGEVVVPVRQNRVTRTTTFGGPRFSFLLSSVSHLTCAEWQEWLKRAKCLDEEDNHDTTVEEILCCAELRVTHQVVQAHEVAGVVHLLVVVTPKLFPIQDRGKRLLSDQHIPRLYVFTCHSIATHIVVIVDVNLLACGQEALISATS
ncbi:hypothetical protein E2C01_035001 [Portunus trituberculatus]|uniref:Uncharacterized protein n=1 Tax=Portunus trituberculatus TaxID=210409 RepID=A0A5B7F309_PORTR|nr:hypothetical protein [Portunus trituberculatus]